MLIECCRSQKAAYHINMYMIVFHSLRMVFETMDNLDAVRKVVETISLLMLSVRNASLYGTCILMVNGCTSLHIDETRSEAWNLILKWNLLVSHKCSEKCASGSKEFKKKENKNWSLQEKFNFQFSSWHEIFIKPLITWRKRL